MPRDNVVINHDGYVFGRTFFNFFLSHAGGGRFTFHGGICHRYAAACSGSLLTKADTTAAAAATTFTKSLGIATNRRDFLLFFHQYFVESANGLVKFLAQARSALISTLSREFGRAAGTARTRYAAISGATAAARRTVAFSRTAATGSATTIGATGGHFF